MERYAIAVDLDGTLAEYHGWKGIDHIGKPIPAMVEKCRKAFEEGKEIHIFTARLADEDIRDLEKIIEHIDNWISRENMPFDVTSYTCVKHKFFKEFWDDRAVQVIANTGIFSERKILEKKLLADKKTVPELLRSMADTFEERNAGYKDNFKVVGAVMEAMFPNGVELKTADDYNRWHLFELMIVKMTRFTNSGLTHKDSIHDSAIYAAMVESLTKENSNKLGNK